eukprot:935514-Amphidinium_carterae.1
MPQELAGNGSGGRPLMSFHSCVCRHTFQKYTRFARNQAFAQTVSAAKPAQAIRAALTWYRSTPFHCDEDAPLEPSKNKLGQK